MSSMQAALLFAGNVANNANCGYSQSARNGPNYDCSSLIAHALIHGNYKNISNSMWTGNEAEMLIGAGFIEIFSGPVQPGDILLTHSSTTKHTVLVYDSIRYVHASSSKKRFTRPDGSTYYIDHPESGDQWQVIADDGYDYEGEIKFTKLSGTGFQGFARCFRDPTYDGTPGPKPGGTPGPTPPPQPGPEPEPIPVGGQGIPIWLLLKLKNDKEVNLHDKFTL